MAEKIITESFFDGYTYHNQGPYRISIDSGNITGIEVYRKASVGKETLIPFIMPGMTETHCHLFLKGGELDLQKRAVHLKSDFTEKVRTALDNLQAYKESGITYICDAGDSFGINKHVQSLTDLKVPGIRQAEMGISKCGHYGRFIARQGKSLRDFEGFVQKVSRSADVLKILLTGIIDFKEGKVKGKPQFTLEEMEFFVKKGSEARLKTMVHCSGTEGLEIAIEAGVDSIEHGYFLNRELLKKMRDKSICWVPTISPVQFHYDNPEYMGWSREVLNNLKRILENHKENVLLAEDLGVSVFIGSDAGSYGVPHGPGFIEELCLFHKLGIPTADLLNRATVAPRVIWGIDDHSISTGNPADIIVLNSDPFIDFSAIADKKKILSAC